MGISPGERKWQPSPVFLPGKSHRQRLAGDSQWDLKRVGYDRATNNNNNKCGRWNLPHLYFEAANTLIVKEVKESFSFLHHCFLWRLNCIFYWNMVALQCCVSFPVQQSGSVMYILYPPTPVFLSGELHGQRSMVGYSPWSHRVGHT